MAKKILKGVGGLLGIGKKKKAAEPAATEPTGPIIKQLGGAQSALDPRRRRTATRAGLAQTILSDKLGA